MGRGGRRQSHCETWRRRRRRRRRRRFARMQIITNTTSLVQSSPFIFRIKKYYHFSPQGAAEPTLPL